MYTVYKLKQFYLKKFSFAQVYSLDIKTVLFETIQFSIITQFSSIWPIHKTLSGATISGHSGSGNDSTPHSAKLEH